MVNLCILNKNRNHQWLIYVFYTIMIAQYLSLKASSNPKSKKLKNSHLPISNFFWVNKLGDSNKISKNFNLINCTLFYFSLIFIFYLFYIILASFFKYSKPKSKTRLIWIGLVRWLVSATKSNPFQSS